jgi:hypothetical protein
MNLQRRSQPYDLGQSVKFTGWPSPNCCDDDTTGPVSGLHYDDEIGRSVVTRKVVSDRRSPASLANGVWLPSLSGKCDGESACCAKSASDRIHVGRTGRSPESLSCWWHAVSLRLPTCPILATKFGLVTISGSCQPRTSRRRLNAYFRHQWTTKAIRQS